VIVATSPSPPIPKQILPPDNKPPAVVVEQPKDDKYVTYELEKDGTVTSADETPEKSGWVKRTRQKVWNSLVPENLSQSVSKDYIPVRKWQLTRDFLGSFAGTASLAAVMTAVGPANAALAALSVAGISVANVHWLKDRIGQVSSIAATNIARVAEKNPKPWMMVGDIVNNVSTVVDAATVIMPPVTYFPVLTGLAVIRSVAGAAAGAAGAEVAPRQALKGNLGEVSVKNGNQGTLATFAGATVGIAALGALQNWMDFGSAAMIVASVGAVGGMFANYAMLQALDYTPLNEKAMRRIVDNLEQNPGQVVGPDPALLKQVAGLASQDSIVAGDSVVPLLEDKTFPELRETYKSRPYIMSIRDGAPYIVRKRDWKADDRPEAGQKPLREDSDYCDKMAQVQAVYQALQAEKLLASEEYASRRAQDEAGANRWVIEESLKKTPEDIRPFLVQCHAAGWSVDTVRFWGEDRANHFDRPEGSATNR
jgi:hypothetical protein